MGRAYFYCVQCSKRISDADLDTGKAYKVGDRILCLDCTPESQRVQTSKRMPAVTRPRNAGTSVVAAPPPPPAPAAPQDRRKVIVFGILMVILAVVLFVVFRDADGPRMPAMDFDIGRPSPPVPPPPPPPIESKEATAKADLDRARAFAKARPEDLAGRQRAYLEVVWKWEGTEAAREAAREAAAVKATIMEKVAAWSADLEAQIKGLVEARDYGAAEKKVQELKAAHDFAEWKLAAEKRGSELHALVKRPIDAGTPPLDPKPSTEASKASLARFEAAAARATRRDFAGAVADLEGAAAATTDATLKAELQDDLEILKKAAAVHKESMDWLRRRSRGIGLLVSYRDGAGGVKQVSGPVLQIDADRVEIRGAQGGVFIEWADVTASTLTEIAQRAAFEPRTLAALCLLEGEIEAAKAFQADLSPKWWTWAEGARARIPKPDPVEKNARELYAAAENAFRSMETRLAAIEHYRALRADFASTALVKLYLERISRRSEAGREYFFVPADFKTGGAFQTGKGGKLESAKDSEVQETLQNFAEIEFAALPGQVYRCWLQVGACCEETFGFFYQGTELTDYDSKKKQKVSCDPGTTFAVMVKHSIRNLKKTHDDHRPKGVKVFPKTASRWEWVEIVLPKYAAPGSKKLRFMTNQAGFSIGGAVVTVSRKTAPVDSELKELEKARPFDDPPLPLDLAGLVARWTFDEDSGDLIDHSGKGHPAKRLGAVTTVPGRIGAALHADGGNSGAEAADAPDLRITGDLTLAIWVRKTGEVGDWTCVLGKGRWNERNYGIWLEPGSKKWMYQQYGATVDVMAGKLVEVGRWIHLAVTIEKDLVRVYTNGALDGEKARSGPPSTPNAPLGLGYAMGHKGFIGDLDDARVYSRALSGEEIRALYELGK
jgi:hypothetical protein